MTVYADTLVFLNTFVTYFLLMSTQLLCRRPVRRLRILASSVIGGLYALTLLAEPLPLPLSLALRAAVCVVLRLVADGVGRIRTVLKGILVFLLLNGLYAGVMLLCRLFVPQLLFSSGIVYLDVSIPFLLVSTLAVYLCIRVVTRLFSAEPSRTHTGSVTIRVGDLSVCGTGIFDTGNRLADGFTGKPVLIVRPDFIRPLVPQGVAEFLDGKDLSDCDIPHAWRVRLRLFPYSSVGADGLLPAFRCDSVVVTHLHNSCTKEKLYIAVSPRQLYHGEADALFPAALYEEISEGETKHDLHNTRHPYFFHPSANTIRIPRALHQRSADAAPAAQKAGGSRNAGPAGRRRRNRARSADRT